MKVNKFVALFDLHVGYENGREAGNWGRKTCHNKAAIKNVLNFINDFAPDTLILGGDQLQVGAISHWNRGKPRFAEGLNLKRDMEELYSLVMEPLAPIARKVWHDGNHEQWAHDLVAETPGLEGLVEPTEYLKLKEIGYEVYSQGEISSIGKLHFVHGDTVLGRGTGANPARTLVNAYRRNIRSGHLHTYSAAIEQTAVDAKDFHSGIVVPSLSHRNPYWIKNNSNCFMQGFLYGYVWADGSFNDYVVVVNNDIFTVNGKKYHK